MSDDSNVPFIIKSIGILLVFVGVIGFVSGIFALNMVKGFSEVEVSRDASKELVEASTLLARDKNNIQGALDEASESLATVSGDLTDASDDLSSTAASLEKTAGDIGDAAMSLAESAASDRAAAGDLKASADAMDTLWGPTDVASNLRSAASKMEESATRLEAGSVKLGDASASTKDASTKLTDSSAELETVGSGLNETGDKIGEAALAVGQMTTRFITNINNLLSGIEWLEGADTKAILSQIIIYFMLIHLLFAATGGALILLSANIHGW